MKSGWNRQGKGCRFKMEGKRRQKGERGRRKYGREGKRRLIVTEKRMESARQGGIDLKWKGREGKKASD